MDITKSRGWRRGISVGVATIGTGVLATAFGVSAAASSAATGEQATPRAGGACASGYSSGRDLTANQQLVGRATSGEAANGVATEPVFSRDSRANRFLAFTSTATNLGSSTGKRNVYVVKRTGRVTASGNAWQAGQTVLISKGGDGDSYGASISGYTGARDAAKGPRLLAFLSTSTNLPGGNPSGTSAYTAKVGGGGIQRVKVPGTATGVGISGDSKVLYVATTSGLYVRERGKVKKIASGNVSHPSTTLNGKQAAYEKNGTIFTVTKAGRNKRVTKGTIPYADGGEPAGGAKQGLVRAISFTRGGGAWRAEPQEKGRIRRFGTTQGPTSINGGGNGIAFGNGANVCLEVRLLDASQRRGGYNIPQGACPAGQGRVTDVGVSTRYNYLAFTCQNGGLYIHYVGSK